MNTPETALWLSMWNIVCVAFTESPAAHLYNMWDYRKKNMSSVQFSDVQLSNLSMMVTIRDGIKRDQVSACCQFGLHADQASFFDDLSFDQMLVIVAHIGQECLFPPRQDLLALLRLPLSLAGPIAAVHPPHKAVSLLPKQSLAQRPRPG